MSASIACGEFEVLLADYLDGTLGPVEKAALESHRAACAACAELAKDASGALAFMEKAASVAPPPALVNRILFEVTNGPSRRVLKPSSAERLLRPLLGPAAGAWIGSVLQPRFVMGMAMAAISLAMVGRFGAAAENGLHRAWDRAVKGYESLQLVYEVQSQLQEWGKESEK